MTKRRFNELRKFYSDCSEEMLWSYLMFAKSVVQTKKITEHIEVLTVMIAEYGFEM